jgi:hypothetical protein
MSDNLELFSEPETIAMSDAESFELQTESTVESVIESSESQSDRRRTNNSTKWHVFLKRVIFFVIYSQRLSKRLMIRSEKDIIMSISAIN